MLGGDIAILFFSLFAAFSLRLGEFYLPPFPTFWLILLAPILAIPIFVHFGLYHAVIRYIGFQAIWAVVKAVFLYALVWGVLVFLSGIEGIPRSVILINWALALLFIGGSRMAARWVVSEQLHRPASESNKIPVVIYGAGEAGRQLRAALAQSYEFKPVAFIDDDRALRKQQIAGLRIYARYDLDNLIQQYQVQQVLVAIPSLIRSQRNAILSQLEGYPVHVRTLPGVAELAQGRVKTEDLREVSIADLLGRDSVAPNKKLLQATITGKVVMVTGAGGSIGSELCRQIVQLAPKALVLFERSEFALYSVEKELLENFVEKKLAQEIQNKTNVEFSGYSEFQGKIFPILGSVGDRQRVQQVCRRFGVQTIFHAAAYKHVPMVEFNPGEGVRNNIYGTWHCAQAAMASAVETFVLISTDKAVRPTNTMGCSKRVAELALQALAAAQSTTRFVMVRFGNVLGSSGSVIPLFERQIHAGGPVTVTHPDIIRYFMTIPEAAQLVIQAGAMGQGGDVFVLDMGKPVKIVDLAKKMIHLSGLELKDEAHPNGEIEIEFTGLRPGEKLYEELLIGDNVSPTDHPMIMRAEEEFLPLEQLEILLGKINRAIDENDPEQMRELLIEAVPDFSPQCEVKDLLVSKEKISEKKMCA